MKWILALAVLLFAWNLWGNDLWAPDEPYFAEGAREMVADGEWLVPHVGGKITTDKPPLFFWLIALFSLPFGTVTAFTARLPSVLAALGTLVLVMKLGERTADRRTGMLAGIMLVTTHMFWDKARWAQIDSLLTFLILIALVAFHTFRAGRMSGRRAGLLFWAACALAVLAKGPIGLLLPLGIAALTLAVDRDLGRWRRFAPVAGPAVFVAVLAPWLLAVTLWGGEYSVWAALEEHFINRAAHGMHHLQPFWYYATVLPYALLPWSLLILGGFLLAWRRRSEPFDRFLLVWALFVILFFTVSKEKRDLYILPAVPALTLMSARLVAAVLSWWPMAVGLRGAHLGKKWVTVAQGIVGALIAAAGAFAAVAAGRYDPSLTALGWMLGAIMAAGGGATLFFAWTGKTLRAIQWSAGTMVAAMLATVTFVYPALNPEKSGRVLAQVVDQATAASRVAGRPILSLGIGNVTRSVSFYSGGIYLEEVSSLEELEARLPAAHEGFALVEERFLDDAPTALRERFEVLYETRLSRKDILFLRVQPAKETPL